MDQLQLFKENTQDSMPVTLEEMGILAIMTETTCGEACWCAMEDVCRCSCGGKNHGIFRRGGSRPERTCKIKGMLYKVHTICQSYYEAKKLCYELRKAANDVSKYTGLVYYDSEPGDMYHSKSITPNQAKWPEVQNVAGAKYIIWQRI